jgi:hypothetical protein
MAAIYRVAPAIQGVRPAASQDKGEVSKEYLKNKSRLRQSHGRAALA